LEGISVTRAKWSLATNAGKEACEGIGRGELKSVLLSGCEDLATFSLAVKQGYTVKNAPKGISVVNATGERNKIGAGESNSQNTKGLP
jgi:hypothetical protein